MDSTAQLLNRPKEYCNIDGVGELGIGFMCLSFALFQWLQTTTAEHSIWNQPYSLFAFFLAVALIIQYGTKAIKKRVTYPRTGFVEYRKRDVVWISMILGALFSALFAIGFYMFIRKHWDPTMAVCLVGLGLAGGYGFRVARMASWKWLVVILMTATSIILAFLPPRVVGEIAARSWTTSIFPAQATGAFLVTMATYGILTLTSGAISFFLYLRHAPAPERDEQ